MDPQPSDKGFGHGFIGRIVAVGFLALIELYRLTLSAIMGRRCRFLPSCSEYAADVIRKHGAWSGFWLALGRVLRCNPWGGHGFDPAPEKVDSTVWMFWRHRPPEDD